MDIFCTASDSVATWAARAANVTAEVVVEADTVAIDDVGALATSIASACRASCSNGASDTSRICWISAGSRLRKRERMTSGGSVVPVRVRRRWKW